MVDQNTYRKDNVYVFMLPKIREHSGNNFVIEDYFPWETKKQCIDKAYNSIKHDFCSIPINFQKSVKSELKKYAKCKNKECFKGFKTLLDKIESIITENEQCTPFE